MLYIFSAITALLLATAQSLWKTSTNNFPEYTKNGLTLFQAAIKVLFSLHFISGAFLYIIATLIYLWMFSNYSFYAVQISIVSFAIIFSFLISHFVFKETANLTNYLGIPLILLGVLLIIWKR
ncbi:hypothetical protein COX25_01360 [bacterium (Candidatus Howlettbacteria) CG23_combo_of_CG06-09_8_20_14_all_37_9]|nr:MAG: hypothetical protein COX25_01360 [bacterium (Candidatus Howlettbacteria) CG23_combo_of_CG06-09_8_20_14_all_37_9]